MSNDVLQKYDEEYLKILTNISKNCSSALTSKKEQKMQVISAIMSDVENAEKITLAYHRERLMKSNESLERTTEMITNGQIKIHETKEIGNLILNDLRKQKLALQNSEKTVQETNARIEKKNTIVTEMIKENESYFEAFLKSPEYAGLIFGGAVLGGLLIVVGAVLGRRR